jgi:hypothetical protein
MALDPAFLAEFQKLQQEKDAIQRRIRSEASVIRAKYDAMAQVELDTLHKYAEQQLDALPDLHEFAKMHPSAAELARQIAVKNLVDSGDYIDVTTWDRYHMGYYLHIKQGGFRNTVLRWKGEGKPTVPPDIANSLLEHKFIVTFDHLDRYIGPN